MKIRRDVPDERVHNRKSNGRKAHEKDATNYTRLSLPTGKKMLFECKAAIHFDDFTASDFNA
ncbi:MAG: hypothetical protein ACR2O0_08395 [Rhizobiaceae bacterium]